MDQQTRALTAISIADSGHRLKKWISVLDDLAEAQALIECRGLQFDEGCELHAITLELALTVTQAYAQAFNAFVDYAIDNGLPGVGSQLQAVAQYKDLFCNARGMFDRMCEVKTAAMAKATSAGVPS